jgi:uncharacterized protein (TIGR02118 family)
MVKARARRFNGEVRSCTAFADAKDEQLRSERMIKVTTLYPNTPGARFDHDYFCNVHMPLVKAKMGASCLTYTVDKGLSGNGPGIPPAYIAISHIFCGSMEALVDAFTPHADELRGDIRNFTDVAAVVQISEVVVR